MAPPLLKICGLRQPDQAAAVAALAVDAVGVIGVPSSPRWLEPARRATLFGAVASTKRDCLRVLVVASRPNLRYPHAPTMAPTVLINPSLVAASDDLELGWEGCLSVPGVRGRVPRHREIEVAYLDRQGQPQRRVWEGFVARIFQHEADHLEGILFTDRIQSETDLLSEDAYQALDMAALGGG